MGSMLLIALMRSTPGFWMAVRRPELGSFLEDVARELDAA